VARAADHLDVLERLESKSRVVLVMELELSARTTVLASVAGGGERAGTKLAITLSLLIPDVRSSSTVARHLFLLVEKLVRISSEPLTC
jgi:hypothetical protein